MIAFILSYLAFEEPQENINIKARFENYKIRVSFIVDGRNQIASKTLLGSRNYWRLAIMSTGTNKRMNKA
jgi:hypothetical protein